MNVVQRKQSAAHPDNALAFSHELLSLATHRALTFVLHYLDAPRNLRFPYYVWGSEATAEDLAKKSGVSSSGAVDRQHFRSALISNANRRRTTNHVEFFKKLHARKPLLAGGRFMNNIGEPLPIGGGPKLAFNRSCKFSDFHG
jgi:hypothetical protein